ncbi:MAG: 1,6-anhydro-N-acetylmuramyl-L-alanine amidase AmpD [Arenicellales bacterium]
MSSDLDTASVLLKTARQRSSPNCDERPEGMDIEALIIHAISLPPGEYGGDFVEQFFCNELEVSRHCYFNEISELKVSSHFYIHRNGELVQFVPVHMRAWHAGKSCCMQREAVNDFSIGIELEGCDDDTFEDLQYQSLIELSRTLISAIPTLSAEHVYGHADIAPGRKTDPGPRFDWQAYRTALLSQEYPLASKDSENL